MSWEFYKSRDIKSTQKPHDCLVCGREIPIGKPAFNWTGKYDGDMQNNYMCRFCYENGIGVGEDLSSEDFSDWLREQDFMECPSCHSQQRYDFDWEWDLLHENVIISCTQCDHDWIIPIGWEKGSGANGTTK